MGNNIVAFGPHFKAIGAELKYNSIDASLDIIGTPKKLSHIINAATEDITRFVDTANYTDGAAAIALADYIDSDKNPLRPEIRENILVALGVKQDGRFIRQVLSLSKSNRSWHTSAIANDCDYFGSECTDRGTANVNTQGKRSFRAPEEYHRFNGKGEVNREQLVTVAVEVLFRNIPEDNFISGAKFHPDMSIIKKIKSMTMEQRLALLEELGISNG